jgi:mono/diheme cytochrome c family protein
MKLPRLAYRLGALALVPALCGLGYTAWLLSGPGPGDFAGSDRVPLGRYKGGDPTGAPRSLANATLIERGHYLALAADCAACHTAPGGRTFAGGFTFVLPFGNLYSTNITPDKATGIGEYSDADFLNAVRRGIRHDGQRLYPAMPFVSYSAMTDADVLAIKAYLFSLPPEHAPHRENTLWFPFNQRPSLAIWSVMFNPDKRFEAHEGQSLEWNRGAYLVNALEHCGECHTPRTLAQSLDHRRELGGALVAGWNAFNISQDSTEGVGSWSDETLAQYLHQGHSARVGGAAGPMREAANLSLLHLDQEDIAAMVIYLKSAPAVRAGSLPPVRTTIAPSSPREGHSGDTATRARELYAAACTSCHGWTGSSPLSPTATLTGVRSVNDGEATNVVQAIISGVATGDSMPMPAFGQIYSDHEIALISNYVTDRFGSRGAAVTAEDVAVLRKQSAE